MLESKDIVDKIYKLKAYHPQPGYEPVGDEVWAGEENGISFKVTKSYQGPDAELMVTLTMQGSDEDERKDLIYKFDTVFGEPGMAHEDSEKPGVVGIHWWPKEKPVDK